MSNLSDRELEKIKRDSFESVVQKVVNQTLETLDTKVIRDALAKCLYEESVRNLRSRFWISEFEDMFSKEGAK